MKDKAAHACRALCRARVAEKLRRRQGTRLAEHLNTHQQRPAGALKEPVPHHVCSRGRPPKYSQLRIPCLCRWSQGVQRHGCSCSGGRFGVTAVLLWIWR
jgi:hypothetical protein